MAAFKAFPFLNKTNKNARNFRRSLLVAIRQDGVDAFFRGKL